MDGRWLESNLEQNTAGSTPAVGTSWPPVSTETIEKLSESRKDRKSPSGRPSE